MNFQDPNSMSISDQLWLKKLRTLILQHAHNKDLVISDIAKELAMSKRTFERKVMKLTGKSPKQYVNELKLQLAYRLVTSQKKMSVREVCDKIGFSKPEYFSRIFKKNSVIPL